MDGRFEWDPIKAANNLRKHGVSFETATRVFTDPCALIVQDRIDDGERWWQALGRVEGNVMLLVVRERGGEEVIRTISARRANRQERRRYDEENG